MQSPYAYVITWPQQPTAIFTWPNIARKFIRDVYTNADGELALPPEGHMTLSRHKVNPKPGHAVVIDRLDIARFLADGKK